MPYNNSDLFVIASNGIDIDPLRVLATYANPKNWEKGYNGKDGSCQWIWNGPTICAFDLAEWGLTLITERKVK